MAKVSKDAPQPAAVKKSKKSSTADKPKASKIEHEANGERETAEDMISHRSEARRLKKAKGLQATRVPPAELMDLVYNFLNDYNYTAAVNSIRSHHNKRPGHDYQQFVKTAGTGGFPDLSTIFDEWKAKSYAKPKQEAVTNGEVDLDEATSDSDSDSSSSDSAADSEDDSEDSSDDEMADDSSATIGERQVEAPDTADSSSESSSDSSSDSSSESETEDVPAKKAVKAKATPVPASSSSSSDSGSSSDSESESDEDEAAGVPLPDSDDSASSEDSSSEDSDSSSDDSSDEEETKVTITKTPVSKTIVVEKKRKLSNDEDDESPAWDNKRVKKEVKPFSRIPDDVKVDPRLASNAYVSYGYADEAHNKLIITKGKDFTKAKNKGKRGSYRGGMIDIEGARGIKFDD